MRLRRGPLTTCWQPDSWHLRKAREGPQQPTERSLHPVFDLLQRRLGADHVIVAAWRAAHADCADDLIASLDHHAAGVEQQMRHLGERARHRAGLRALDELSGI